MNTLLLLVALICFSAAHATYQHNGHKMLQSVPDISSYGKTSYPAPMIHELGEYSEGEHSPEIIKIIKTYEVKVPVPYPVKVPHKVPYPVAYKVPQIVKVPHIVKIAHPVPVEVVKHVPVPQQHHSEGQNQGYGIQQHSGDQNGGYGGYAIQQQQSGEHGNQNGDYGYQQQQQQQQQQPSGGYESYGAGQQSAWQGIAAAYGAYSAPQADFGGSAHGAEQTNAIGDYQQQNQYSTIDQSAYQADQGGNEGQEQQEHDHTAQASQEQGQSKNFEQQQSYQVAEMHETTHTQ